MKNTNVKLIRSTKKNLFLYWMNFLKPYHKLSKREIEAMSILLFMRSEIAKDISNPEHIDRLLFSSQSRKRIKSELGGMSTGVFNNLLTSLRRKRVLTKENRIIPGLIPDINKETGGFNLIFNFEMIEDEIKQS